MHIVHEYKSVSSTSEVLLENGNDFLVDCFVLGITDGVFAVICSFAVFVETECPWRDVRYGRQLGEETVAKERFPGATHANKEHDQLFSRRRKKL